MQRIIFALLLQLYGQESIRIFCHKDENYYLGSQWVPIYSQNTQNQEALEFVKNISISNLNDQREFIQKSFQQNQLQLIFFNYDHYLCKFISFKFNYENNILQHYEEILMFQLTFQLPLCSKFLNMYSINTFQYIFCEDELQTTLFILESSQNGSPFNLTIKQTSQIDKISGCYQELYYSLYKKTIYLAFLNCQNWVIYVINDKNFEILVNSSNFNHSVLKSFLIDKNIILQFDHKIYILKQINQGSWIYENPSQEILYFFSQNQYHIIFLKGEKNMVLKSQNMNHILVITNQLKPKQVLKLQNQIIINYDGYIEVLDRIDANFILPLTIDNFIQEQDNYPYIFAFYLNQIILLRINSPNPTIQCEKLTKNDLPQFKTNHLFENNHYIQSEIILDNYENLLQNNILYEINLRNNTNFSFQLSRLFTLERGLIPFIQFQNQSNLSCQVEQDGKQMMCEYNLLTNVRWQKLKYKQKLFLLFQKNNQKLYIKNCSSNSQIELGKYEFFEDNNIYDINQYIFLVFQNQTKILIINFQPLIINQTIIEFKEQIIDIHCEDSQIWIITNSCKSYILLHLQQNLLRNNKYLFINSTCYKINFFGNFQGFVQNGLIVTMKNNITNVIKFQNFSVINIFKVNSYANVFLIHLQNQDGDLFSKCLFINNQFITLFNFPKLNFKYTFPLIYQITKHLLIVAAYASSNINVLLVYYFNNYSHNSLIEIIEVDNFNFQICDEDMLLYNFNKEIKIIKIQQINFICEISEFSEFVKHFTLPITYISKFNTSQSQQLEINLKVRNLHQNLSYKKFQSITILFELQNFPFDPRQYICGPIEQIKSSEIIILDPMQKQGQISKVDCQKFINQICINQFNQQFIINAFKKQEIITLTQEIHEQVINAIAVQDIFILIFQKQEHFEIIVQNNLEKNFFSQQVPSLCQIILDMKFYHNYYVLTCTNIIYFYKIHHHSLETFSFVHTNCNCLLMEISNSKNTLIYKWSNQTGNFIALITIYDDINNDYSNRTQLQIFELNQTLSNFTIQSTTFVNSSYYELIILEQQVGLLQQYEASLNISESFIRFKNNSFLLRHFQHFENLASVIPMGKDIILIFVNNFISNKQIQIFNISNVQNIKEIDSIYKFQLDSQSNILLYDDQHFIIDSQNEYTLYKIDPYILIGGNEKEKITLDFQNSVSSIKMEIINQKYFDLEKQNKILNYCFYGIGIILAIFIYFCIKCLKRFKIQKKKMSKEIEL